ncbi:hypothetical protein E2C01_031106 [Portunus trituberculatus]|uniref:Uncharacterized protein n=1 Tax=Portunus trituberculatus TaxID=210409 RepID=A0A5B7EX88_PORTR|nr:hypothetical protein [Portunus trituberculatus]
MVRQVLHPTLQQGQSETESVFDTTHQFTTLPVSLCQRSPSLEISMFTTSFGFPLHSLTILVN